MKKDQFHCTVCQQSLQPNTIWAIWDHTEGAPPHDKVKMIHEDCHQDFMESEPANTPALWSLVPLADLPTGLLGIHVFQPYLVAYSSTEVVCLHHDLRSQPYGRIRRSWLVTLYGYELQDITVFNKTTIKYDKFVSIHVPEFMEASWVWVKLETGQILRYGSDLYDVSIRHYASNGPGGYISVKTFINRP